MRTHPDISIYRSNGVLVATVPITAASRRRWRLMEEDCITLSFSLVDSVDFNIGDYVVDEVFGEFVISEDPLPADYDPSTGAYKYELRFDADWILWKNKVFMLPYDGVRTETTWVLTDVLENHLKVVVQNLTALGYAGYRYAVEQGVRDANRAVCVTYSGTDILSALKTLADSYECEFWVESGTIHFGKCETGSSITFSMTDGEINAENMVPTRNDSEYGNRFWVYGSTKNIPDTYRKHLEFKADHYYDEGTVILFKDTLRTVTKDMMTPRIVQSSSSTVVTYSGLWGEYSRSEATYVEDGQTHHYTRLVMESDPISVVGGWLVDMTAPLVQGAVYRFDLVDKDGHSIPYESANHYVVPASVKEVRVRYAYEISSHVAPSYPDEPMVTVTQNTEVAYFGTLVADGGSAEIRLTDNGNLFAFVKTEPNVYYAVCPIPGFGLNSVFTIEPSTGGDGLITLRVPTSYYTDDGDQYGHVRMLMERRLMLPVSPWPGLEQEVVDHIANGYVQRESLERDEVVERVVYFEEIYPRCALRVTRVDVSEYDADVTYSDGSRKVDNLPAYTLQAKLVVKNGTDADFPFDPDTMMGVGKLTATFLTPDEAKDYSGRVSENSCLLMGMTFDVAANRSGSVTTYQLAWNADYGDKLPNEILKPQVGDCFILAGWNTAAMPALGLIQTAENELARTADEYAALVREAQFTFDCSMMSDWALETGPLPMGQRVSIHHSSLANDLASRVIGFEFKLDIPYDTPIYTVGETEAYSRLREIEKSLRAQSQSASSSSNAASSSNASGGGPSSSSSNAALHLVTGTMSGMSSVDYDGSEEKTMRIPSVLDHLVDSAIVPRIGDTVDGVTQLLDKEGNELQLGSFFEAVVDPTTNTTSIKLKSQYTGLWAEGFVSAGGIGSGGGGGGTVAFLNDLTDVAAPNPANGNILSWDSSARNGQGAWVNVPRGEVGTQASLVNGASSSTISVGSNSASFYTTDQIDSLVGGLSLNSLSDVSVSSPQDGVLLTWDSSSGNWVPVARSAVGTPVSLTGGSSYTTLTVGEDSVQFYTKSQIDGNLLVDITAAQQDGTMTFVFANGDSIVANLNHEHQQYVPITRTINGVPLSSNITLYVGKSAIQGSPLTQDLTGINSIKATDAATSQLVWDNEHGAWRVKGNLYADGWVAAGGIGSGSGGGGGASSLYDLPEVGVTSPQTGQFFYYNGTKWVNTPIKTINNNSLIGEGNISISGGGGSISPATASSLGGVLVGSVIATPTINAISSTAGRYYYLQTDSAGHAFVNVPWEGSGGGGAETDPIFTASAAYGITSTDITNWNAKAEKTGGSDYNFLVSRLRFGSGSLTVTQASGITAARLNLTYDIEDATSMPTTTTTVTRSLAFHDEIPTALPNPNKLYFVSTNGTYYDGSAQRVLTADVLDAPTKAGNETITGSWTFSSAIAANGGVSINSGSVLAQSNGITTVNYGARGTTSLNLYGTSINLMSRNSSGEAANLLAVQNSAIVVESKITPNDVAGIDLGADSATKRWANIYGVNGNLSGNLVMASTGHIDIGPVRLEFANGALHVTTNDSTNYPEMGFYADGFVSAGGIQSGTTSYEVATNKVTSISASSTDTQYPSAKCMYDIIGNVESLLAAI